MNKINRFSQNKGLIILLILFIVSLSVTVLALRSNNIQMTRLRQAVYTADEQNGDIEKALNDLRSFVFSHMNTNLRSANSGNEPPIQLVHRFNRAVAAEQARIAASGGANKVYVDAQSECETSSLPLTARAQCMQDYITTHGQGVPQLNLPPKELYTFDFASPTWSPDLAGIMIIVTLTLGLTIVGFLTVKLLNSKLR